MVSVGSKLAIYLFLGMALYLLAGVLAFFFRLLFPSVQFVTVEGRNIDIVNYLILGTFDLILFSLQTVLSVLLLVLVWVWNGLIINVFFHGIGNLFNIAFLKAIQIVPESNVTLFVNALDSLRLLFVGFVGNFFGEISDGIAGLFGGMP